MSNFISKAVNPLTGQIQEAIFIDNHFGLRKYGIFFPKTDNAFIVGDMLKEEDFDIFSLTDVKRNEDDKI